MVDIHTHIMFDIDDGSRTIEESIELLKKHIKNNITKIVLTPHYIENSNYNTSNEEKIEKFNILKDEIAKQNLNIDVYLGNEVYVNENILSLIKENKISTINNSRYILIEFPMLNEDNNVEDIIYNLKLSNLVPIIAHPERYTYIKNDLNKINKWIEKGALIQINKDSLFDKYGKDVKKTAKKLLKNKLVHFIATDVHHQETTEFPFEKFERKIQKLVGIEYYNQIVETNGLKVINNEEI